MIHWGWLIAAFMIGTAIGRLDKVSQGWGFIGGVFLALLSLLMIG
jgi:uncharacterized membrane-anchored protein